MDATIFTNACGPCIGQWARDGADKQEKNSIIHSFNRNFSKRADGNPNTHAFVASPEMVAAVAISGRLDFNPITDKLINQDGEEVRLEAPAGLELPPSGFDVEDNGYLAPEEDGSVVSVVVKDDSERLQLLTPFCALGWQEPCRCQTANQGTWKVYNRPYFYGRTMVALSRSFGQHFK